MSFNKFPKARAGLIGNATLAEASLAAAGVSVVFKMWSKNEQTRTNQRIKHDRTHGFGGHFHRRIYTFGVVMICANCEALAKKTNTVFHRKEVISILAAQFSMLRVVMQKGSHDDKSVANSVITKMLLSLDPDQREGMIRYMEQVSGVSVKIDHCQHSTGQGLKLV